MPNLEKQNKQELSTIKLKIEEVNALLNKSKKTIDKIANELNEKIGAYKNCDDLEFDLRKNVDWLNDIEYDQEEMVRKLQEMLTFGKPYNDKYGN